MKTLSIKEPYASLIKNKVKHYETRSYDTKYRGEIFIHASLGKKEACDELWKMVGKVLPGYIICKANLVDSICMDDEFINEVGKNHWEYKSGYYKPGRYAWKLENVEVITPIKAKGNLGLWNYYSLEEVMNFLIDIKYGYMNNAGNVCYNFDTFDGDYVLQSYKDMLKTKAGVCFDQVELERHYLYNRDITSYFICYYGKILQSHTFLVVKENNKYIWFEHAWEKYRGIYEYNSLDELLNDVKNNFMNEYNILDKDKILLKSYSKPKSGIGLSEYFKWVENNFEI